MHVRVSVASTLALLASFTGARADWPTVPSESVPVSPAAHSLAAIPDGQGGAHFVWHGPEGVKMLRFDALGVPAASWPAGGLVVSPDVVGVHAVTDQAGGVYLAWGVRLQRVGPDGSLPPGWPANGWQFSTGSGVRLAPDVDGGVYVSWVKNGQTYATRVRHDMTLPPGWLANGRAITPAWNGVEFQPDGAGGCYFAWRTAENTIRVEWRNPLGQLSTVWTSAPPPEASFTGQILLAPDGQGGVYVAFGWGEHWGLTRLTSAGFPAPGWPANDGWISGDGCLEKILADDGDVVLAWMEGGAMRAARWMSEGSHAPGWALGQVTLPGPSIGCTYSELEFDIETDGAGGLFYTWLTTEVRAGRIDASGAYSAGWPAG